MNQLSFLDQVLKLSEAADRSLDCILALELECTPSQEELNKGLVYAQGTYSKTSCFDIPILKESSLEDFINKPLQSEWHLEEALIGNLVAVKMSHILGDGVSLLLFARAQLQGEISSAPLVLHSFSSKRDTPYREKKVSEVWPPCPVSTGKRGYFSFSLTHQKSPDNFSLNDVLSLAILNSLPVERKSLWVPVNVRRVPYQGFGNGLSRMRLYPLKNSLNLLEQLQFIRRQKREAWKSGEIFLPKKERSLNFFTKSFLKAWLKRPWADWGSISFSHVTSDIPILKGVKKLIGVTNIPKNLNAAIFAYSERERTDVTITYLEGVNIELVKKLADDISDHFNKIMGIL